MTDGSEPTKGTPAETIAGATRSGPTVAPDGSPWLLEVRGLTKRFPGVVANDDVDLTLARGEILGLLGENGAGKSTLVKMLFGIHLPDEGTMWLNGTEIRPTGPGDAIALGIGMVHQHFQLVAPLTVAENIVLGAEPRKSRLFDRRGAERRVREISEQYGLEVEPSDTLGDLPVGIQQRVEILKALYRNAELLILDEPTAVLTPQETDELLAIMRDLAANGVGIIFITHKLREVLAVTDRVTVLRRGRSVGTVDTSSATTESLAELMVGRSVVLRVDKGDAAPGPVVLSVQNLEVRDDRRQTTVRGATFEVHAGEIVGIAGVEGNGQRELVEAITGIRPIHAGTVTIEGFTVHGHPRTVREHGVAYIPEDRERDGLVGNYSVADNLVLTEYHRPPYAGHGLRHTDAVGRLASELVEQFDVRTPSIDVAVSTLSGGNKQKVIVARELSEDKRLVVASQPTRGVDVGSIEFIHNQLVAARDRGSAVLLVSAELDEIFGLADRIAVIYEGRIVAVCDPATVSREDVGLLMAGGQPSEPVAAG
ncbi:MAG: ABC transporter ATP-binding protein [Acidimicrobiales bacterium]